jgi:Tir chaperone family protein CesT
MSSFDTVKQYLLDFRLSIVSEDPAEGLMVLEDEDRGLKNLLVDCEEPILVFEQIIMPVPSNPGDMFRRLLQMNRCVVQGAFTLDEEGKRVLYRDTLQLANLDPNEVERTIEALSLTLAEFASEGYD